MTDKKYDAIIVGCGIAGLGVAAQLARQGRNVICFERDAQAGGRLQSFSLEGG